MSILCPHCQNTIDAADVGAKGKPLCPVCGYSLPTVGATTVDLIPPHGQSLGRFELIAVAGAGGFGTVYKARDPQLDRVVAVKVPRAERLTDPAGRARFLREARSVSQLRHPGIVPVLEAGEADGVPFVVGEFVTGITLADRLSAGCLTPAEAATVAAEVADALEYAHEQGVIHRDVKPSNIMLEDVPGGGRRPRLTDFGLARRDCGDSTLTREEQVLGTPAYMAPEQARGDSRRADSRSDVYSLGVVLYQMLTGELPFRGTERMVLHQVLHADPRSPRSLNDRIPRDLETITLKALAKDPGGRYPRAADLADDLRRFLTHRPILARPIGRLGRAWRWAKRNPVAAAASGVAAAAVLAAVVVSVAFGLHQYRAAEDLRAEQDKVRLALGESERHRAEAGRLSARLALDHGLGLCEAGEVGPGLVWLARSLELAADDADLQHAARANLGAWHRSLHPLRLVMLHPGPVYGVAVHPDGRMLASGCGDGGVRLWDAATGEPVRPPMRQAGAVRAVAFSPDGRTLLAAGDEVRRWDPATGHPLGPPLSHPGGARAVAFTRDGRLFATGGADGAVRLWDAATGQPHADGRPLANPAPVHALAFSPDGRTLAAAGGPDDRSAGTLRL